MTRKIVHVDAKIIGRDKKEGKKRVFIAYKIKDGREQKIKEIENSDAEQTDAAELYAIDLAIQELKSTGETYTILCDNQSIVTVLTRKIPPKSNSRQILRDVWKRLHETMSSFEIAEFSNEADKILNEHWNEIKASKVV